jgi:alkylated DNA repair dioxygenase AlkB
MSVITPQLPYTHVPLSPNSDLVVVPQYDQEYSYATFASLPLASRPTFQAYGRLCQQHRDVGFYAEDSVPTYAYSNQRAAKFPLAGQPALQEILQRTNQYLGTQFNGILVNHYHSGTDYISAHADEEGGLCNSMVASVAYGAERIFRVRRKSDRARVLDIVHPNGALLLMRGKFQQEFLHEIPPTKKISGARISLTFRCHREG